MSGKTILLMIIVIDILSVILNTLSTNGNSSHFAAPYLILLFLFLFYSVLSILLTTKLYRAGSFQWISANPDVLKIVLVFGIVCILYTVFTSIMIRADWSTYQNQSLANPKDFLAYTAYIWVPLLMIVPYAMATYKHEMAIHQSAYLKAPLILNVVIGIIVYIFLNNNLRYAIDSFTSKDNSYHPDIEKIQNVVKLEDYLHYTLPNYDKKIIDAAFVKLKSDPAWDEQFYKKLEDCNNNYSIGMIHKYLSIYTFEYPEKLMPHFKKSMSCIATYVNDYAANEFTSGEDLSGLNIENVLQAIERQYPGTETIMFDALDEITSALRAVKREDYKSKTVELIDTIEKFKLKFQ